MRESFATTTAARIVEIAALAAVNNHRAEKSRHQSRRRSEADRRAFREAVEDSRWN